MPTVRHSLATNSGSDVLVFPSPREHVNGFFFFYFNMK